MQEKGHGGFPLGAGAQTSQQFLQDGILRIGEERRLAENKFHAPQRITLAIADDATGLPAALADKSAHGGVVAYLCRGSTCSAPIDDLSVLLRDLPVPEDIAEALRSSRPDEGCGNGGNGGNGGGDSSVNSFAGNLLQVPRIVVPSFAAGTLIIGVKSRTEVYEDRIGFLTAVQPRVLGVELAYGGYMASGTLKPAAFAKITFDEA